MGIDINQSAEGGILKINLLQISFTPIHRLHNDWTGLWIVGTSGGLERLEVFSQSLANHVRENIQFNSGPGWIGFNPPMRSNRSSSNRANCFDQILVPQNQLLWDLGIQEQSMDSQMDVNPQLEVGPGYNQGSFKVKPFPIRCWKTNLTLSCWPSSLTRALWFLQSTYVGIWSRWLIQIVTADKKTWNCAGEISEAEFKKEGCCERNDPGN